MTVAALGLVNSILSLSSLTSFVVSVLYCAASEVHSKMAVAEGWRGHRGAGVTVRRGLANLVLQSHLSSVPEGNHEEDEYFPVRLEVSCANFSTCYRTLS